MSGICTWVGPYPPSRPKGHVSLDCRTYIWSQCRGCGWVAEHLEGSAAMEHSIAVANHRCPSAVQLDLFAGASS